MASGDVSTENLPDMGSIRARFEAQASASFAGPNIPASPRSGFHRSRSSSISSASSDLPTPTMSLAPPVLRSSSSSSSLKVKKPPPPPPAPRGSVKKEGINVSGIDVLEERKGTVSALKDKFAGSDTAMAPFPSPRAPASPSPSPLQRAVPPPPVKSRSNDLPSANGSNLTSRIPPSPPHSRQTSTSSQHIDPALKPKPAVPARPSSRTDVASPFDGGSPKPPALAGLPTILSESLDQQLQSPVSGLPLPSSPVPRLPPRRMDNLSSSSDTDLAHVPKTAPPPPPRRPVTVAEPSPTLQTLPKPPALPARATAPASPSVAVDSTFAPPIPARPSIAEPVAEKPRGLLSGKIQPPPQRVIALGERLPPRKPSLLPTAGSGRDDDDEDSDSESDDLDAGLQMPDTSRSSRRPPHLWFKGSSYPARVATSIPNAVVLAAASIVIVAGQHHIRVWDLDVSPDLPVLSREMKALCGKDSRVTAMEWLPPPSGSWQDEALIVWIGTKDGHLIEMEVPTGVVRGVKYSAHAHAVGYVFRSGRAMITVDPEGGKCLVFGEREGKAVNVTDAGRVVRISEKQDIVKMFDGKLYTAARSDVVGPTSHPVLRYIDPFTPGLPPRTLLPHDNVGPVLSMAIVPTMPHILYVGHDAGWITVWSLTGTSFPTCIDRTRIGPSDVLTMVGVHDRLWVGFRNGEIKCYDVAGTPWVVTNAWVAHSKQGGLTTLRVDSVGLVKGKGRVGVISINREEVRWWDGLLEGDWIDQKLVKQEESYSTFHDLRVLLVSWNVDSARPDSLTGNPANVTLLHDILTSPGCAPDIISFGFQEVIDLENRKLTAKSVILGGIRNKADEGGLGDKVSGAYKRWYEALVNAVRLAMPPDSPYVVIHSESLVGLFSCVFVKRSERSRFRNLALGTVKRGMGGRYGNKGGILARFAIEDSSICFINCHLAAGQNSVRSRNADVAALLEASAFAADMNSDVYVGGGDGSMVLDHEIVFFSGDMNYRIDARREAIISAIHSNELASLHVHDQLLQQMKLNRGFRLRGFSEGPLTFNPTYKYDRRSSTFDSSEKRRSPAWCDRVLWRGMAPERVQQKSYSRWEADVSDHRPISSEFVVKVRRTQKDVIGDVKAELQKQWVSKGKERLAGMRAFYSSVGIV